MGEGSKYATASVNPPEKFIEQINYQEIDEGEVSFFLSQTKDKVIKCI